MSIIEANLIIDLPDGVDFTSIVQEIQSSISMINGSDTKVNVSEMDNPLAINPINLPRGRR